MTCPLCAGDTKASHADGCPNACPPDCVCRGRRSDPNEMRRAEVEVIEAARAYTNQPADFTWDDDLRLYRALRASIAALDEALR